MIESKFCFKKSCNVPFCKIILVFQVKFSWYVHFIRKSFKKIRCIWDQRHFFSKFPAIDPNNTCLQGLSSSIIVTCTSPYLELSTIRSKFYVILYARHILVLRAKTHLYYTPLSPPAAPADGIGVVETRSYFRRLSPAPFCPLSLVNLLNEIG